MLKDIKSKIMLVCCAIVFFMILFVLYTGRLDPIKTKATVKGKNIINKFNKITNNYSLKIKDNKNNLYYYYNDSKIELYEKDGDDTGYIKYNNKYYSSNEKGDIKKTNDINFISDENYNLNFIKSFIEEKDYDVNKTKVVLKINMNEFMTKYNNYFNKKLDYDPSGEVIIELMVNNYVDNIKIIYPFDLSYTISIFDINKTDFNVVLETYKDKLK